MAKKMIEKYGEKFSTTVLDSQMLADDVSIQSSAANPVYVETMADGYKSTANSTADAGTALTGGATWSGASDSPLNYGGVRIIVHSTQASATNGLKVYCSGNGTDWFLDDQYTIPANTAKTFAATIAPYIKVTFTNGATPCTLRVCTLFLKHMSVVSSHRVQDTLNDDDDGQLTVSVPKYRTAQNTYVSASATNSGNAKISLEEVNGVVVPTTRDDDFYNDAFQRLRVSDTDQRLDVEFLYDKQPLLFDEITSGNGLATYNNNSRDVTLANVGTSTNDSAGLYQHYYNPYTPGNSQFIAITGTLNAGNIAGGTAAVYRRSYVTGSVVEEVINQDDWLAATTGVNWQYSQIFLIDFQSLKVGRIRFALDRGGLAVPVATIENDNERLNGYWQMANAPVGWNIYNTTDNTITEVFYGDDKNSVGFRYTVPLDAGQSMRAICATVKSEGGGNLMDISGYKFAHGNGATLRTVANALYPVLSIQLKTTFGAGINRGLVLPQTLSFQTDQPIYYQVLINTTLTGASFQTMGANSLCNYDVSATAISGGRVIAAGYAGAGAARAAATGISFTNKVPLSVNYAGTVGDIFTIACIRTTNSSAAVGAAIEWQEIR